jgi:peptidyl-prolyl cis-trans isomerase SurA
MIPTRAMSFGRLAAILLVVSATVAPAEVVNRIVATVDGDPITAHEVRRYAEERHARGVSEADVLEAVITDKILEKEIAARKISAKKEDVDRYVAEVMNRSGLDDEKFKAALKEQGLTPEEYRARIKSEIEKTQLLGQEVRSTPPAVSDDDVRAYYEQHKDDFGEKSAVTVRDIFLPFQPGMTKQDAMRVVEQAKSIRQMAASGQSFEALARHYSQGPGADAGGLLGTFKRGEMAAPLEQQLFAMRPGDVTQPMVGPNGVHLMKADSFETGGHADFDAVKEEIRQHLASEALDERFREWISKHLREKHHIEVLN